MANYFGIDFGTTNSAVVAIAAIDGNRVGDAQKIGEDELSALLSRNAREFITGTRKDTAKEDNQLFLNNLLALGLTISDEEGFNQGGSSLKNDLKTMKTKFRLKNQGKNG